MTRFAWLQARSQSLFALLILAALAVAAAITGVQLSHLYASLVAHCQTGCDLAANEFTSHQRFLQRALDILAQLAPALLGIFWGAPLVARELESGTHRLAWTQSVPRSRWLASKLGVVGLAVITVAGLLTLTITWWYRALDKVDTSQYAVFDRRDIAPIGYALFAFAAGALLGAVIRRTVPAMAATLVAYIAARVTTALWVRPHLLSPLHRTLSLDHSGPSSQVHLGIGSRNGGAMQLFAEGSGPSGSWTLSSHLVSPSGKPITSGQMSSFLHQYCASALAAAPPPGQPGITRGVAPEGVSSCLDQAAKAFRVAVTYQPADRYWTLQWLETGMFTALAVAAALGCYWWVTRRVT